MEQALLMLRLQESIKKPHVVILADAETVKRNDGLDWADHFSSAFAGTVAG